MNQTLLNLMLAIITMEIFHMPIEVLSVRYKVKRLAAYSSGKIWKEEKLRINTRLKAYAVFVAAWIIFVLPLWCLFTWLRLSVNVALIYAISTLMLVHIATTTGLDRYHVEIEQLTNRYKK